MRGFTPTGGDVFLQEGIHPYRRGFILTGEESCLQGGYSYWGSHPSGGGVILTGGAYNLTRGGIIHAGEDLS